MTDVPPARQCTLPTCEREAVDPGRGSLCECHLNETEGREEAKSESTDPAPTPEPEESANSEADTDSSRMFSADYTEPDSGVWVTDQSKIVQWMGHKPGDKAPFAPWGDENLDVECDHHDEETTCAECGHDARYKWGDRRNYTDHETAAEWLELDPRLAGLAFIQREDDPLAFVDGDDVRCPDTGEVHPAFKAILNHLGTTYADVSTSGSGVHAVYRGELPDDVKQATFEIDTEPWGANGEGDRPTVEIYDGKHVCIATGEHIPETPTEAAQWDDDALKAILDANDELPNEDVSKAFEEFNAEDYTPDATESDETTSEIRDIFHAIDQLDAQRVAAQTIVSKWNDEANTSSGERAFYPTWGNSNGNGTANIVNDDRWQDTGDRGGYGGPVCMAAIDASHIDIDDRDCPDRVNGETWWKAVEYLRDELGFSIPEFEPGKAGEAVAPLPLERLAHLDRDEAKRYAKKHGREWPSTKQARKRLKREIHDAMRSGSTTVIDAPTAIGKSYSVATTPWLNRADVAGEAPVVHFHETREVRDSAAEDSAQANVSHRVLKGRSEACPLAAGRHDPADDEDEEDPDVIITKNGIPASEWFDAVCDGRGVPFSTAHAHLREHNDQNAELPCQDDGECDAIAQWEGVPRDDDGNTNFDIIHATHQFAHVPGLQRHTNMVFDERPDFTADLPHDRIRCAVTAYLKEAGAPVSSYEGLVTRARKDEDDVEPNEHAEHQYVSQALDHEPDRKWFLEADGAHTLAPALTRAVWYAIRDGSDENGRFASTVPHEPPRLDAEATEDDGWNREYVTVVVDEDNTVRKVRTSPDLTLARSVIGLDAHPAVTLWQRNVHPDIRIQPVLGVEERALWRLFERGLLVAQVGDAVRPYASGEYFNPNTSQAFLEALREEFGDDFSTAITASAVESQYAQLMEQAGIDEPDTMHYGEEKSRDDFASEDIGAVDGSIDPGDDYVLDILAEAELEATPETSKNDDGDEYRARGRGFVGRDAELAAEILASVREQHVAQAAGRYARNADDPNDTAIVFVRTSSMPPGFADVQVPGVEWLATDTQQEIVETLRERESATAKELSEATGTSKEWVAETLSRLAKHDAVDCREQAGKWGADLYSTLANVNLSAAGTDLEGGSSWITNNDVWCSYTWSLAIVAPGEDSHPATNAGTPQKQPRASAEGQDRGGVQPN